MDTTKCRRCHRTLTAKSSRAAGIGWTCARRELAERLARFPAWQISKAREAIELGAVVPLSREDLFGVVSSDGSQTYIVDTREESCTCRSAIHSLDCYHIPAAIITSVALPLALAA